ncbi:uncharacterized protein LOC144819435 [Lissotriton helveticus]
MYDILCSKEGARGLARQSTGSRETGLSEPSELRIFQNSVIHYNPLLWSSKAALGNKLTPGLPEKQETRLQSEDKFPFSKASCSETKKCQENKDLNRHLKAGKVFSSIGSK